MSKTIYILSLLIVVSLTLIIFVYPIINTGAMLEYIRDDYEKNPIYSTNNKPVTDGLKTVTKNSSDYKLVLTEFNLIDPVYTLVIDNPDTEYFGGIAYQELDIYRLNRKGFNSFEVYDFRTARIDNKTYEEAIKIAKQYNLVEYNPDPVNITVYPPRQKQEDDSSEGNNLEEIETYIEELKLTLSDEEIRDQYIELLYSRRELREKELVWKRVMWDDVRELYGEEEAEEKYPELLSEIKELERQTSDEEFLKP
jgi:hypothetical protein